MSILQISLREADETKYWLELLAEAEIVPPALLQDIREDARS